MVASTVTTRAQRVLVRFRARFSGKEGFVSWKSVSCPYIRSGSVCVESPLYKEHLMMHHYKKCIENLAQRIILEGENVFRLLLKDVATKNISEPSAS